MLQRALEAGVLDELQIHLIPLLLARGRRQFDVVPARIELETVRVIDRPRHPHPQPRPSLSRSAGGLRLKSRRFR